MANRHMTDTDEKRILAIIDSWSEPKITWKGLMERIHHRLGGSWTYPTLTKRPAIVARYEDAKQRLRSGPKKPARTDDAEVEVLKQRIASKEAEIMELRSMLAKYDERFARYVYHAHALANLTPEVLDAPLPDLGRAGR